MASELAVRDSVGGVPQVQTIAQHFVKSGFFKDARDMSQAVVRIMAGAEMGFGPFASMQGVYIIEGKPTIAAGLMASAVKRSGRYNYRVREHTDTACAIEFFEGKEGVGVSRFTLENAQAAGLTGKGPWKSYPRNMLFARAMSNGVKWFCPDIFAGPVYTPEELGQEVDEDGAIIQAAPVIRMVDTAAAPTPDLFGDSDGIRAALNSLGRKPVKEITEADKTWLKALRGRLTEAANQNEIELADPDSATTFRQVVQWCDDSLNTLAPF